MTALTACLIVRNEEQKLPGCLATLSGCAAIREICVLDTGSTDGTVDVARAHGARVEEWPWRDDFAAARNRSTAMARTSWVLVIDADERLHADDARLASALTAATQHNVLAVEVDDVRDGRVIASVPSVRLFRPGDIHYVGRIHETPRAKHAAQAHGSFLERGVMHLEHVGYDSAEAMERRRERNSALAEAELQSVRAQGEQSAELIAALISRGRAAATGSGGMADGLRDWAEAFAIPLDSPLRWWAGELYAAALIETGRLREVGPVLRVLHDAGMDPANLAWLGARTFMAMGRPAEALPLLRQAEGRVTAMGEKPADDTVLGARLNSELAVRDFIAATVTAARLVASHAEYGRVLDIFLALTDGMAGEAARILSSTSGGAATSLRTDLDCALRAHGSHGEAVGKRLASISSEIGVLSTELNSRTKKRVENLTARAGQSM